MISWSKWLCGFAEHVENMKDQYWSEYIVERVSPHIVVSVKSSESGERWRTSYPSSCLVSNLRAR